MINKAAIYHRAGLEYRYAAADGKVYIRLKTACGDVKRVILHHGLRYDRNNPAIVEELEMDRVLSDGISDWFEVSYYPKDPKIYYYFHIESEDESVYYLESGFTNSVTDNLNLRFYFPYIMESEMLRVPEWSRGAVVYEIFPDRFERAEGFGRAIENIVVDEWGQRPKGGYHYFGGNLEGIRQRIPYLKELGVEVLYLTPIFKAPSVHRYDIIDYYDIDPLLGTKDDLKALIKDLHKEGIRIVMDAVFNHCSHLFFAFQDLLKNQEKSRFKDWFHVKHYPVVHRENTYHTFADVAWNMPKLNTSNPEVIAYFSEVGRYWIREYDIDGWRLDVANEVDSNFWRQFRIAVKGQNPEALIVGEVWTESFRWLQGDMFDSVMHYPFMNPVREFAAYKRISAVKMDEWLNQVASLYTHECRDALWTNLDSHDIDRFLNAANGDTDALMLGSFLLLTFPGAPMLYYGTELGMEGANDPDCRRCMEWERANDDNKVFTHFKKLISIRKQHEALRKGNFRTWRKPNDGVYAFLRQTENDTLIAVLNTNDYEMTFEVSIPSALRQAQSFVDLYASARVERYDDSLTITLPAKTGAVVTGA
ncbi:MAG: alpha-glycosidase [Clostridia bacterium]|nr:alpha-glycosidase [Clostridia bacterium]